MGTQWEKVFDSFVTVPSLEKPSLKQNNKIA
jgi:hypothetical protein